MNIRSCMIALGIAVFLAAVGTSVLASDQSWTASGTDLARDRDTSGSDVSRYAGGGGGIPTPFEAANQKAELADGEVYLLIGRVEIYPVLVNGAEKYRPFFMVDLDKHPWLANEKRRLNPTYVLQGSVNYWKQFRGMRIKLPCVAHGVIDTSGPTPEYRLHLGKLADRPVEPFRR